MTKSEFVFDRPEWYDTDKIFDCGQCFRFKKENGAWRGIAGNAYLEISQTEAEISCKTAGFSRADRDRLARFLGLNENYSAFNADILCRLDGFPFMIEAMEKSRGVVLLRQQPWETLISFIISQNNNIPRIRGIVESLCEKCGRRIGKYGYAFPSPEEILGFGLNGLQSLRVGYRDRYIIDAAERVADGRLDLTRLEEQDTETALKKLLEVNGIGPKVASCIALFAFGKKDVFPVDTWIKKALRDHFCGISPERFGPYAGIAQQYIFYSQTH